MTHIINGRSYEPKEIVQAIQKHLGLRGDLELMGQIIHTFRLCRQWEAEHKSIPLDWRQPEQDYWAYMGGVLPDPARRYFMEVVEPTLRTQKAVSA